MKNLYEDNLRSDVRKLDCDGLLFVEYQCVPGNIKSGVWSQHSFIAYVLSGKKSWISPTNEFTTYRGDALYCKKGGHLVHNFYEEQFCTLLFFFPDEFIRETVLEFQQHRKSSQNKPDKIQNIIKVEVDTSIETFFDSVLNLLYQEHTPSKHLVKLKFQELILQLLSGNKNPELTAHFLSQARTESVNLKQVMQDNFLYRLPLIDFAKLCNRSLSAFKRDFRTTFGMAPGRWLNKQRLNYAQMRLLTSDESISEIAYHSGFETTSHFIRCFKKKYGYTPLQYRRRKSRIALAQ